MAAIFPSRSTMVPFWIVPFVTVRIVPPLIATMAGAARVCARGCPSAASARQTRRNTAHEKRRCDTRASRWTPDTTVGTPLPLIARGPWRGLEQILVEPLDVVLHRRPMALRLRRTVADAAETLIHDQLRRHVLVLQPLVQFERVGQRHALIGGAVLDQRRRLRLFDVRNRRRLRVDVRILPRRRFQVLS